MGLHLVPALDVLCGVVFSTCMGLYLVPVLDVLCGVVFSACIGRPVWGCT